MANGIAPSSETDLPRLKPADLIALSESSYVRARERLLTDLESAGAGPDLRMTELKELDRRRGLGSVVVRHAFTIEGATEIIERSIEIANNGIDIESLELDPSKGMVKLALRLIGVDWAKLVDEQKTEETETEMEAGI